MYTTLLLNILNLLLLFEFILELLDRAGTFESVGV